MPVSTTSRNPHSVSLLERWARFAYRRRWLVVLTWIVILAALLFAMNRFGGQYSNSFKLPGSEAQEAQDILKARFPARSGDSSDLVFQADAGIADPAVRQRIEQLITQVQQLPDVSGVDSPYEQPALVAAAGTIARAPVQWRQVAQNLDLAELRTFVAMVEQANGNGLRVEAGGNAVAVVESFSFSSEAVGLGAAVVILLIAFGSVIAMGLPILAALFGLGTGFALLALIANFAPLPQFSPQFAAMIGIGVGIDYSLLVVTRFREGLHTGHSVEDSIAVAVGTAGRSVVFAGVVVAIAFLGLYAMGLPFIAALGAAGAIVVGAAVLVALTLMPALLAIAGRRIDSLRVPLLHSTEGVDTSSNWFRLSTFIQHHPVWTLVPAVVVLLVLATPIVSMHLGFSDFGNNPKSTHTRRAYDLLKEGFGPGFNGPLVVVGDFSRGGADRIDAVSKAIASTPGIVQVSPALFNQAKDTALFTVIPSTGQQDSTTSTLVTHLREDVIPAAMRGSGGRILVAGQTAAAVDIGARIQSRLPLLFVGVIGLSFLLLMMVFRSVLVAVKAAVVNLLSIGASYGVLVAVFQWGWGGRLIGIEKGPIETFLPMMLFAILFGLSMDYEVFLISRIREEYVEGKSNSTAVSHGLTATARVITAAAAIMVTVFFAFVFGDQRIIKEFGVGLATAIFVDATIVRLVMVPSMMELLGEANWWLPRWLDRALPHINLERPTVIQPEPPVVPVSGD